jgi:hypothetical protein
VLITDEQQSFEVAAGTVCSFALAAAPVANNEITTTYRADANGDIREITTGTLKLQLTNVDTGKSIVVNVSGPGTVVLHPDGSATEDLQGPALVFFSRTATPAGPATHLFNGHTTLELSRTCFLCPRCLLHGFPHRSLKKQPIDGTLWTDVQPRAQIRIPARVAEPDASGPLIGGRRADLR